MLKANDFKVQFERVSSERYEERKEVIEEAVGNARDLREWERAKEVNEEMKERVIEMVQKMFVSRANDGVKL